MSLRARLALSTSILVAVVLVLGGAGLEWLFRAGLLREIDVSLQSVGELVASDMARREPYRFRNFDELWFEEMYGVRIVDKFVQLLDRDGKLDSSGGRKGLELPVSNAAFEAAKAGRPGSRRSMCRTSRCACSPFR